MSKGKPDAAQGRCRRDPADKIISDARKPYMLHALLVMIRRRHEDDDRNCSFLSDDEDDRPLALVLYALTSPKARKTKLAGVLPWLRLMPNADLEAFEACSAQFKLSLRNIAQAARLTRADRDRYGNEARRVGNKIRRPMQALRQLPIIDGDLEAERREARNAARRRRRQQARARDERQRQCDRAYRQAKRQADGALPREAYLADALEAARPWESEGVSRRTWYRRRAGGTGPSSFPPNIDGPVPNARKPLNHHQFSEMPDGPEPKIDRGRTTNSAPRREPEGLAGAEVASTSRSLSPSQPVQEIIMDDHDDATDLMEWMIARQQARWRQAMPGIRKQMAGLERQTLGASMTLPQTLHIQAEMMTLRQAIAGMEAAL